MKVASMRYRYERRNTYFMWRALQQKAGLPYDDWYDSPFFTKYKDSTRIRRAKIKQTKRYPENGKCEVARRLRNIR